MTRNWSAIRQLLTIVEKPESPLSLDFAELAVHHQMQIMVELGLVRVQPSMDMTNYQLQNETGHGRTYIIEQSRANPATFRLFSLTTLGHDVTLMLSRERTWGLMQNAEKASGGLTWHRFYELLTQFEAAHNHNSGILAKYPTVEE